MPEQIGELGAQAATGATGAYSLGADGIIGSISSQVAPLTGQAAIGQLAGGAGQVVGNTSSDMAKFLSTMKETAATQTKWTAGTEAVKLGASALLDDSEDNALKLQREAIAAQQVDLTGVNNPNVQGRLAGTTQTGVASSLGRLREKGLMGDSGNLGRRIN
jgi:hypothetical protein